MDKSDQVVHSCANSFACFGMSFPNNAVHHAALCFLIPKMIMDLSNSLPLKVAFIDFITISLTWPRVIDVTDSERATIYYCSNNHVVLIVYCLLSLFLVLQFIIFLFVESGPRLLGFTRAGAMLMQLFGLLFAAVMSWMGPVCIVLLTTFMSITQSSKSKFLVFKIV